MAFKLPDLPYDMSALEPLISARTLEFHYTKHHQGYLNNLNTLTQDSPLADLPLEQVIENAAKDKAKTKLFNNAAQVWNHTFFWNSMKPEGSEGPQGDLKAAIEQTWGSLDGFRQAFKQAAVDQFGSGWAWLVAEGKTLKIVSTGNADLPLVHGQKPLLTCDVWEHAYYLDYQNRRGDFVDAFLQRLINWDFAAKNWAALTA